MARKFPVARAGIPVGYYAKVTCIMRSVFDLHEDIFITGPAGCGKTTAVKKIHAHATGLNMVCVVLAPTQVAAELLPEGRTIHSFLKIRSTLRNETFNKRCAALWGNRCSGARYFGLKAKPDIIVIDEISMVGYQLMRNLDSFLRGAFKVDEPYAGIQIVFVGDFCQLPPVMDKLLIKTELWTEPTKYLLETPLRQNEDLEWFTYLQKIRYGLVENMSADQYLAPQIITPEQYEILMSRPDRPTVITAQNKRVQEINTHEFNKVPHPVVLRSMAEDTFVRRIVEGGQVRFMPQRGTHQILGIDPEKFYRYPYWIYFKKEARYIITMNLNKNRGIINGMGCYFDGDRSVILDNGNAVELRELYITSMIYSGVENIYIQRTQYCLRLGYACTVHRSQGVTLSKAICDFGATRMNSPGLFYVAMSRVRSLKDIYIMNPYSRLISVSYPVFEYYGYPIPTFRKKHYLAWRRKNK